MKTYRLHFTNLGLTSKWGLPNDICGDSPKSEKAHRPKPLCMQVRSVRENYPAFLLSLLRQSHHRIHAGTETCYVAQLPLMGTSPAGEAFSICYLSHVMLLARFEIKPLESHVTYLSSLNHLVSNMSNVFWWGQIVNRSPVNIICNTQFKDKKN